MIVIKGLTKIYNDKLVLSNLSLNINENKITCITGPSGCGKTTLLRIIGGLEDYEQGSIEGLFDRKITFVFQEDRLLPWLNLNDNVDVVLKDKIPSVERRKEIIDKVLKIMKLSDYANTPPNQLSGGMQRRTSLARAVAYDTAVNSNLILLDEPFKGLDSDLKEDIIIELQKLWKNKTVIIVTHDMEEVKLIADEIINLQQTKS